MFHFIFKPIYINERENGEHQCWKSRFLVKNNKRYATGQSVIFHSAQKKKRSNFIFRERENKYPIFQIAKAKKKVLTKAIKAIKKRSRGQCIRRYLLLAVMV